MSHRQRKFKPPTDGVVLSGGGADGAFAVGVLKALFSGLSRSTGYRPLDAKVYSGTSIGSFNAAYMVSRTFSEDPARAADDLAEVWLDTLGESESTCGNGAYRLLANPLDMLRAGCYVPDALGPVVSFTRDFFQLFEDAAARAVRAVRGPGAPLQRLVQLFNFSSFVSRAPWEETLRQTIDYRSIRRSHLELRVAATNWATGELSIYNNADMTDTLGPEILSASSAIPGFFPPSTVGSQPFVDGGILLNTPLRPAIQAGATDLHVIYLDPDIANIPLAQLQNTLETLYRMQQIAWASTVRKDIDAAARINKVIEALDEEEEMSPDDELRELASDYAHYVPLNIHRYFPRDDFGGALGLLDLRRDRLRKLMQIGYETAEQHDCVRSCCVLVDQD